MGKRILIVAAHPDDEILGCGGTVSRLIKEGCEAYTLILGEGITSRDRERNIEKRNAEINALKEQTMRANDIIGVKKVITYDFPDNRFDTVPLLDIIKVVEKAKREIDSDIIFTHYRNDLNIDHRITFDAVITATRPMKGETVREIYSFEVLSSTEWSFPMNFCPNVFIDISNTLEQKLKAAEIYKSEMRDFPHPRSIDGIKLSATGWGMKLGLGSAEAFELVRLLR